MRILLLLVSLSLAVLAAPAFSQSSSFCQRHPGHWRCQPTPSPTATATPTVTPAPSPTPTPPAGVYHTSGRQLLDPCGQRVIVRGVEQMFWYTNWLSPTFVTEIGKTGANTVRVLPEYASRTPTGEPPFTLAQIEDLIKRGIAAHMLVDVAIDGQQGGDAVAQPTSPAVKAMLMRYEDKIVIHAKARASRRARRSGRRMPRT